MKADLDQVQAGNFVGSAPLTTENEASVPEGSPARKPSQGDLLRTLFTTLDDHGIRYCVLHSWEGLPERLRSDLDLAVHPADMQRLPLVFRALREKGYRLIQCFNYFVHAYYFVFVWFEGLVLKGAAVDIICEHRRGGLIAAPGRTLVKGRQRNNIYWIPSPATEFAYLLAKRAWKGTASADQAKRLRSLVSELGRPKATEIARSLFRQRWAERVVEACSSGSIGEVLGKLKSQLWRTSLFGRPAKLAAYLVTDGLRRARRWFQPTGVFLVLMGPDGAGKSALGMQLAQNFDPTWRGCRVFHWRPEVVFRMRDEGRVTDPHRKPVHGTLPSAARLLAFVLDHWLGYIFVIRPLLARSTLVIFDRYFHDLLVDPQRYRYGGPLWLARILSHLVPSTERVFLVLDARDEVILSRKHEVTPEELRRQRGSYQQLRNELACASLVRTDEGPEKASAEALRALVDYMDQRFQRRHARWLAGSTSESGTL